MHILARVRLTVARHPWIYWSVIAVVAGVVAFGAASAFAGVDAERRSWGRQAEVWMSTDAIEPGQPITAAAHQVPVAVVPIGAAHEDPAGTIARQRMGPGEIVTDNDVSITGSVGLIPAGWVAFAVPASGEHFATGDHLEVYSGQQLVGPGLAIDVDESDVMVAVTTSAAPALAAALLADSVTLALTPAPSP